jgi:hypothetical protein
MVLTKPSQRREQPAALRESRARSRGRRRCGAGVRCALGQQAEGIQDAPLYFRGNARVHVGTGFRRGLARDGGWPALQRDAEPGASLIENSATSSDRAGGSRPGPPRSRPREAFHRWGDADAGCKHLQLFRRFDIAANVRAEVLALPPGHPYLRLPLQFTTALEPRLLTFVDATELARLRTQAEVELREPERWGTTFTLLQSWGRVA